jgi:hypothetical protein
MKYYEDGQNAGHLHLARGLPYPRRSSQHRHLRLIHAKAAPVRSSPVWMTCPSGIASSVSLLPTSVTSPVVRSVVQTAASRARCSCLDSPRRIPYGSWSTPPQIQSSEEKSYTSCRGDVLRQNCVHFLKRRLSRVSLYWCLCRTPYWCLCRTPPSHSVWEWWAGTPSNHVVKHFPISGEDSPFSASINRTFPILYIQTPL